MRFGGYEKSASYSKGNTIPAKTSAESLMWAKGWPIKSNLELWELCKPGGER